MVQESKLPSEQCISSGGYESIASYALNSVVQSTRLIRGRSAVRICECVPIWSPRLKDRTPDSQSGNDGFPKGLGFAVASPTEITSYVVGSSMAEHRIVVPAAQVRFLSFHPNLSTYPRGLRRQAATLLFAGSNPAVLSTYGKVAPMVERRIEVPGGAGSSPALTTNNGE